MSDYLRKNTLYPAWIKKAPAQDLFNMVVIPCYNEPQVEVILQSLINAKSPTKSVEVIVVVNAPENASEEVLSMNSTSVKAVLDFVNGDFPKLQFHLIEIIDLPKKHAGVGLARKIGMDEAVRRLLEVESDGVITCLDADCEVNKDYLTAIESHFLNNEKCPGASIRYRHPLEEDVPNLQGIIDYELHLRYYNQGLKYAGLPYAFHTVGSSMTVRCNEYQRQGGMNRRKAGEDFYFLHKFTGLPHFGHIEGAVVYPSSRDSDRVPFGTGKAMMAMNESEQPYETYPVEIYEHVAKLVSYRQAIFEAGGVGLTLELDEYLDVYLQQESPLNWKQMCDNASNFVTFEKRFFAGLSAFWVMKYANAYRRDRGGASIKSGAKQLLDKLDVEDNPDATNHQLLYIYRTLERE